MATEIALEHVVRVNAKGRPTGRVHLTALVPDLGDVHALCGKHFPASASRAVDDPVDCQACLRRQNNASIVSAALFEAGLGEKLLELSLQQVGEREPKPKPTPPAPPPPRPRVVADAAPPGLPSPLPAEDKPGELRVTGMKEVGEDLYRSPGGVLIRLRRRGETWQVAELVYEGKVLLRRRSGGKLELRIGDVEVELEGEGGSVRAVYSLG